jgi:2-haloalkanoic acid dehalogenase type II
MQNDVKAIFFDLGGTLFSYREVIRATMPILAEAATRLQVEAQPADLGRAFGIASKRSGETFGTRPYFLHRDYFLDAYRHFARELGGEASEEFLEWIYTAQRRAFIDEMRLRRDCMDTLEALRERGLYLSVVSNIDDDYLHPMVERLGLDLVLDHWTSSEEARSCKPDPVFFQLALEKTDRQAHEVLFVGDSREHDVAGARNAGMTTVLIEESWDLSPSASENSRFPEPHHRIGELSELLALVG